MFLEVDPRGQQAAFEPPINLEDSVSLLAFSP